MTVALWCVLIALFLPILCTSIAKLSSGRFNLRQNHDPRAFLDKLEGMPRRAMRLSSIALKPSRPLLRR